MNGKTIAAGIAGGLTLFATGALLYVLLLAGYFEGQMVDASIGKDPPGFAYIVLGEIVLGVLLAVVLGRVGANDFATGAKHGAVLGLLFGLGIGLIMFGAFNISSLPSYLIDAALWGVRWGVAGGVVALILGRGSSGGAAE